MAVPVFIDSYNATGSHIQSNDGVCNFPVPSSPLSLQMGTAPGALGPVYHVVPTQSHSGTYTALRIRARKVSGALATAYNVRFVYDHSTDTWTWGPDASTMFSFSVVPNYALIVCPTKD